MPKNPIYVLPFCPTVNTYYRMVNGRMLISAKGRAYRNDVLAAILASHGKPEAIEGPVSVDIQVYPPDRKRRDLDNLLKSVLDSLTHAGVWLDDSQVCDLHIYRCQSDSVNKGTMIVEVKEVESDFPCQESA